ncbi:MAG: C39 family peptidase [Euryarchaeota archaeon]|nr:C39 family peptidase [Euryarchaeota archaeon]
MVKKIHSMAGIFAILATCILIVGVFAPVFSPSYRSTAAPVSSNTVDVINNSENHLIQGVPYVGQETNFYCAYATPTMLFKYYGINTTLHEVVYYAGIGHTLLYVKSVLLSPQHIFIPGISLQQLNDSIFLASLYGLSFNIWYPNQKIVSNDDTWQQYWSYVKENISQDIPVTTSADPYTIPHTREHYNPPDNTTHGGHSILLIGFNETNGTICYNDPAPALWDDPINGTYVYISKDILRSAVENTTATKFVIGTYQNYSGSSPLTLDERLEKAHERNIQKINGDKTVYSELSLNLFSYLGIKGLKAFRRDLRIGITHRMTTVRIDTKLDSNTMIISSIYDIISIEKNNASQYLFSIIDSLQDKNLQTLCAHDAMLLQRESDSWKQMSQFVLELYELGKTQGPFMTWILSFPITTKMKQALNEMISIENAIITGN